MTHKAMALSAIKAMGDSATMAEIQYALYVVEKINRAKADIRKHGVLTVDEARRIAAKWK